MNQTTTTTTTTQPFEVVYWPETLSGHKAHVFADNPDRVASVMARIAVAAEDIGWGVKIGTDRFFEDVTESHPQHGKGVTVYFPRRSTWEADLAWLVELMEGCPFAGDIAGDDMVSAHVGYRYEFHSDPGYDIDSNDCLVWYKPAH